LEDLGLGGKLPPPLKKGIFKEYSGGWARILKALWKVGTPKDQSLKNIRKA